VKGVGYAYQMDNVTLTWLTNSFISGARTYWEDFENKISFFGVKGVPIPVAVSVFPDELYPAPRSWAERAYPKLIHYNKLDKGGHFAAWEQPQVFSEEVRAGFSLDRCARLKRMAVRTTNAPPSDAAHRLDRQQAGLVACPWASGFVAPTPCIPTRQSLGSPGR
jgi:hypothetical protein